MKRIIAGVAVALGVAAVPLTAQSDALRIHGYLSQAYVDATEVGYVGIPTDPSTDYRSLALQVRYALSDQNGVVVQLSHKRLGVSPAAGEGSNVELDWAFFQQRLGNFNIRAGRLPTPRGLYNEFRDVGTLLPFYRAPYTFYTESPGIIDGIDVAHMLSLPLGFTLESHLNAGAWDSYNVSWTPQGSQLNVTRMDKAVGAQFWLLAPMPGVRVGGGIQRFEPQTATGESEPGTFYQFSGEGKFDRIRVAAEWEKLGGSAYDYRAYYATGGLRTVGQLWLNGQAEFSAIDGAWGTIDLAKDYGIGASYALSPFVVLKLEGHQVEGYSMDAPMNFGAGPQETRYVVASVSAAF